MKNKKISEAWNQVELEPEADQRIRRAILQENSVQKPGKRFFFPLVISMALVLVIAIPLLRYKEPVPVPGTDVTIGESRQEELPEETFEFAIHLEKSSPNIQVRFVDDAPIQSPDSEQLMMDFRTEEELLAHTSYNGLPVAAFYGTVRVIHQLEIATDDHLSYWFVAELEIIEDLRTDIAPGTIIPILLPPSFISGLGAGSILDFAALIEEGTNVILLPQQFDENATFSWADDTLYLDELAPYGLPTSMYDIFVETPEGLAFNEMVYESFLEAETLADVAEVIRNY